MWIGPCTHVVDPLMTMLCQLECQLNCSYREDIEIRGPYAPWCSWTSTRSGSLKNCPEVFGMLELDLVLRIGARGQCFSALYHTLRLGSRSPQENSMPGSVLEMLFYLSFKMRTNVYRLRTNNNNNNNNMGRSPRDNGLSLCQALGEFLANGLHFPARRIIHPPKLASALTPHKIIEIISGLDSYHVMPSSLIRWKLVVRCWTTTLPR